MEYFESGLDLLVPEHFPVRVQPLLKLTPVACRGKTFYKAG